MIEGMSGQEMTQITGTLKQHPEWGRIGWWWEFKHAGRIYQGYAITKRGAIRQMKRTHNRIMKQGTGKKIEVEL